MFMQFACALRQHRNVSVDTIRNYCSAVQGRLPFVVNCEGKVAPETFMTRGNAAELRGEAVGAAARALSFVLMPSGCTGCDGCENNARSAPVAK